MIAIARTVLTAAVAAIDFTSIPQTYRHLLMTYNGRATGTVAAHAIRLQFNGDTALNYADQWASGNGTAVSAGGGQGKSSITAGLMAAGGAPVGASGGGEVFILDYARTDFHKPVVAGVFQQQTSTTFPRHLLGGNWNSPSAVTSIRMFPAGDSFDVGTVVNLYGLNGV